MVRVIRTTYLLVLSPPAGHTLMTSDESSAEEEGGGGRRPFKLTMNYALRKAAIGLMIDSVRISETYMRGFVPGTRIENLNELLTKVLFKLSIQALSVEPRHLFQRDGN